VSERIGKYVLEERIGAGGMAEVYRARVQGPQGFEKIVAVKRVLPIFSDDGDFVRMFIQEARVAARLQHGNIVQIFDFDEEGGRYYIAMEYVAGKDLRVALRAAGAPPAQPGMPMAMSLYVAGEVLRALHYAQQTLGLVHRDISPHNVLLGFSGDVKLGDFGIAKAQAAASATRTGSIKGKIAYMAPEQVDGAEVDGRTDLFAMGIVLYEMLSGKRPFSGASDAELVARIMSAKFAPLHSVRAELPEDVAAVVERLLQRDPAARFQTALEAFSALTACASYHADSVGLGTWLQGLFPDVQEQPSRVTRSEAGGRTAPAPVEAATAFALAETRTSDAKSATVPARKRRRSWLRWAPLPAGILVLGALALRSAERPPQDLRAPLGVKPPSPAAPAVPAPIAATPTPPAPSPSPPAAAPAVATAPERSPKPPARVRKRARTRAPRGPMGVLDVGIHPSANIKINGKEYGSSPKKIPLPAGTYRLDLTLPGDRKRREPVTIQAGQTTKIR